MRRLISPYLALLGLCACGHSETYVPATWVVGPYSAGPDVQLTFNVDQDYWPTWTQDGKGILYAYVDQQFPQHRCIGLLPSGGGTRTWQLCDNRAIRRDTLSSYTAFALDRTGRLLFVEATATNSLDYPLHPQLLLADTATPYVRATLMTLPITVGNVPITWLSDLQWTGPNTFLALGQQFGTMPHCYHCLCMPCPTDSTFAGNGVVVVGTIGGGHATLRAVDGTQDALGYSLLDDNASIAFIKHHDTRLFTVPLTGGDVVAVANVTENAAFTLLGVTCRDGACLVANAPVNSVGDFAVVTDTVASIATVSLSNGTVVMTRYPGAIVASPQVSPISGDAVFEMGLIGSPDNLDNATTPVLGHLQTFGAANSVLQLRHGALP